MSLLVKVFVYALWVFPVIDAFNFAISFSMVSLVRVGFGFVIAYYTVNWSLKLGGAFYLFCTVVFGGLALAGLGAWIYFVAAFMAAGAYTLLFSKSSIETNTKDAKAEFTSRELDYQYKGYEVYKSPNFFWCDKESFKSAKEVEAYIEDLITINSEGRS
jgi:hypothetical protein